MATDRASVSPAKRSELRRCAFAAFPAAHLRGKRDFALFFKGNVTQTKSLSCMGHARRETAAFRHRPAADTTRWRERLRRGVAGFETSSIKLRLGPVAFLQKTHVSGAQHPGLMAW